jgi:hypothetical protein
VCILWLRRLLKLVAFEPAARAALSLGALPLAATVASAAVFAAFEGGGTEGALLHGHSYSAHAAGCGAAAAALAAYVDPAANPALCTPGMRERQWFFYTAQLKLAQKHGLPVVLHVRRSADGLLKGLRQCRIASGIAHAFNGSAQQAQAFVDMGFVLGFGGTLTYERSLQLRRLACNLPLSALVLETDAPDIPPQWLYQTAEQRVQGAAQGRNSPAELPHIAQVLTGLRRLSLADLAAATTVNACRALPKLAAL